jgi:flagellar biosynthesis chaperone FliJ
VPVSKSVRQLLRVLDLEEELSRREFGSAQAELAQFEAALRAAGEREREGRSMFTTGVQEGNLRARLAGQAEVDAASYHGATLREHIRISAPVVDELRTAFLEKRVERKQAETLVKAAEARESIEEDRRTQQSLDSWYLMRPSVDSAIPKYEEQEITTKPELNIRT